ncbi:hypothetical protein Vi05172_g12072 [Venturia inaequalis]|nr:hypothetical protein Vi05172_g12072 [Venturia inaequalis]
MVEALAREQKERALKARFQINDDARMTAFESLQLDFPLHHPEIVKFKHEWADEANKFHEDMRKLMGPIIDFPQTQPDRTRNTHTGVSPPSISFVRQDVQHAAIAQSTQPSQSSLDHEYLDASVDANRSIYNLRRRHSSPEDHDSAKTDETDITFPFENCTVICHHESRGMFEIFCPTCQGNSVADATVAGSTTQKLVYLPGPTGVYTHFRQVHEPRTYINFATFEKNLLNYQCEFVKRDLTVQQANEFGIEGTDEESIVPKVEVEAIPNGSSIDRFPYLDSQNSSVVLRADGYWVELRCPIQTCRSNSSNNSQRSGEFYKGANGFEQHIRIAHGLRAPEDEDKWEWVLNQCSKWTSNPIVDIRRLNFGDIPIIPIKPSHKRKVETSIDDSSMLHNISTHTNPGHDLERALSEDLERFQLSNKRQRFEPSTIAPGHTPVFNIFRPLEPTHRSQSSPSSARPAMYHDYSRGSTPASPGTSRRPHADRIDLSTSQFSDSRPFPPTRRSSDLTNAESNSARMNSDIQDPTNRTDSPELNSQHPRPRWQSMAPPVPTFGTPARTLSNGVMAFSQSIKPAMPPNSRTGNPKGPELGHLEELHFLERVCPCTLNGHPCKAEGGCCRQQLCIDVRCQAEGFKHNIPGCPYDHDIRPTCGRGCLQLDNDMFDVIMKTGQCAFGHDEKATRLRLKAHQCFNH